MALDGSGISRRSSMALDGSGISRPSAAPPQSRIELEHVLSLDELPRLGFLPLIFCSRKATVTLGCATKLQQDVVSTTLSSPE